ncbi:MAG: glycosyltransferase family 2 protein [Chitinophagaceae bacterium]|nr:glycosyltransferase family 2 protein [Chitinophagaceae bacterium]
MDKFSIVIVAKNSEDKIKRLLQSLQGLTDDVVVCDTGSTDKTMEIAQASGASLHRINWEGYGITKNIAIGYARYDWILSLDSDEKIDAGLYTELQNWRPDTDNYVYQVLWKNFLNGKWIRHSDWGNQWKTRLFNKNVVHWDKAIAHEDIEGKERLKFVKFKGYLEHYSFKDTREYAEKMIHSAMITAEKYHQQGKGLVKLRLLLSPLYSFIKSYILKRGILDGYNGFLIAVTTAYYTFIKYARLNELKKK